MIFDEESMLQDKSETKNKAQGKALNSSTCTQKKRVEFSENPKKPDGQMKTPQIQMETNRRPIAT